MNLCGFYLFLSFKILHVFQFSEGEKTRGHAGAVGMGSACCRYPYQQRPCGPRQPDCVTANCVPNSHRELNQPPPPPPRKRKKKKKNILNHPFYKLILNHPLYKLILNHPFFFFRGLGYSLDFFDPQLFLR